MLFLSICFVAAAIPYALERLYLAGWFFAALFWLFVFQLSILFGAEIILENHLGESLPGWIKSLGIAIGIFPYLTIGLTPIVAVFGALTAGVVIAAKWFSKRRYRKMSGAA
jgi:hypothetical protein